MGARTADASHLCRVLIVSEAAKLAYRRSAQTTCLMPGPYVATWVDLLPRELKEMNIAVKAEGEGRRTLFKARAAKPPRRGRAVIELALGVLAALY